MNQTMWTTERGSTLKLEGPFLTVHARTVPDGAKLDVRQLAEVAVLPLEGLYLVRAVMIDGNNFNPRNLGRYADADNASRLVGALLRASRLPPDPVVIDEENKDGH